jgi:predicted dehydrogenase
MAAFARAVQTGEQPLTGGEHAVEVVRVLEEADRCMKREREAALVKS